jgi:hypothetical protein
MQIQVTDFQVPKTLEDTFKAIVVVGPVQGQMKTLECECIELGKSGVTWVDNSDGSIIPPTSKLYHKLNEAGGRALSP